MTEPPPQVDVPPLATGNIPRPTGEAMLGRALRLRCPRCGVGKLFRGWLHMHESCSECGFRFDPDPGFYLGSMYINYGFTALFTTMAYVVGRFRLGIPGVRLLWPLAIFCVVFPILMFRHSRALWLTLDCILDEHSLRRDPDRRDSL